MKNKAKIISIISVVLILIIGIAGYFMYQKAEEEKAIKKSLNKITKTETSFSKVETHEEKLNILKSCINEMTDYNKSKENFKQVTDKYKSAISSMQEVFTKEYDSIIEENTLSNLDSLDDISAITNNKDNLSSLLSTIEAEKDYVLSSNDDFESYQQKITELTESYTNRITALEEAKKKAEEEAKRKAEEEAKRKAEEEARKKPKKKKQKHIMKMNTSPLMYQKNGLTAGLYKKKNEVLMVLYITLVMTRQEKTTVAVVDFLLLIPLMVYHKMDEYLTKFVSL